MKMHKLRDIFSVSRKLRTVVYGGKENIAHEKVTASFKVPFLNTLQLLGEKLELRYPALRLKFKLGFREYKSCFVA